MKLKACEEKRQVQFKVVYSVRCSARLVSILRVPLPFRPLTPLTLTAEEGFFQQVLTELTLVQRRGASLRALSFLIPRPFT